MNTNLFSHEHGGNFGISFGFGPRFHRSPYRPYFGYYGDPFYDAYDGPRFGFTTNLNVTSRPESAEEIHKRVVHDEARQIEEKISENNRRTKRLRIKIEKLENQINMKKNQINRLNNSDLNWKIKNLQQKLNSSINDLKALEKEKEDLVKKLEELSLS